MNADEAWDDYVRTNSIAKGNASLQGQLNTMQAQMNELSNAVQLLSQVANKVLGQQGEAEAAAAPAPQPGAPPMGADPMAMGADPMAAGGAPPMDPAAAGAADPMAAMAGGAPPEMAPPGAEEMAPPEGAPAPAAEPAPEEGGEAPVSLGDDDLMNALSGADLGGMEDEGGDMAEEEPAPEEASEEEPVPEEAPAEGGPSEGGIQPTDVHAAYEAFIEALKNLAHIAVDDSRLYLVDEIANGINAISATFGSKICPILDEMSMSAENEGETEGGPDDLFSKSYKVYKSAPLVKGMSRKQAVETFMKSGWTAPIKKDEVSEGATDTATVGEPAPETGADDATNIGNQPTEPVAASASPCQEEIEKSGCEEEKSDCTSEVNKSEKSEYQSFRDLMKARAGEHTDTRSDFDRYRIEKFTPVGEMSREDKLKQVKNWRGDYGSGPSDAADKLSYNPDLVYGDAVNSVDTSTENVSTYDDYIAAREAINSLRDKATLPKVYQDMAAEEGVEFVPPTREAPPSHKFNSPNSPGGSRLTGGAGDRFRLMLDRIVSPKAFKDPATYERILNNITDYGEELLAKLGDQVKGPDDPMLETAEMPTE